MKFIGQHIYDLISRFRNDVYLEDVSSGTIASGGNLGLDSNNKIVKQADTGITDLHGAGVDGSANQLLTDDGDGTVTSESTLTWDGQTLNVGDDSDTSKTIRRLTHSDDNGGVIIIAGGNGTGTSKTGGHVYLYGGSSTGTAEGGSLKFWTSTSDGSADANANALREVFEVNSVGNVLWIGDTIGNFGSDNDLSIVTDGSMQFTIDRDNDETSQSFAWTNFSTEIMNLDESGNLQIDGGLTTGSTSFVNSSGVIQVASQTNITGLGTITTGVWNGTTIATANTAAKVTSIVAGDGIDVSGATGDVTVTAEDASATNPGIVELATTGEADTGTDTARAVTPAGLKSHVDARYSYQYIPLSANATTPSDGDWMHASGNGIGNHLYNQDGAAGGTTASNTDGSASTITINKNAISGGIMVPYDSILCGFYAQTRAASNHQKAVGIFTGQPIWNDYIDITAYLRGYSAQDISAGPDTSYSVRAVQHSVLDINYSLSAGEAIWFCLKDLSGSGGGVISSATIVLKTLVP